MNVSRGSKIGLRTIALVYLFVLLVVPIGVILTRTFENGIGPFLESITTPAAISARMASAISLPLMTFAMDLRIGGLRCRRLEPGVRQGPTGRSRRRGFRESRQP